MVGKLIVWAITRDEAINRARRALREYRLEGIKTTIPLHLRSWKEMPSAPAIPHGLFEELLTEGLKGEDLKVTFRGPSILLHETGEPPGGPSRVR